MIESMRKKSTIQYLSEKIIIFLIAKIFDVRILVVNSRPPPATNRLIEKSEKE